MQRMQGLAAELIEQRQKFAEQNFTERGLIRQPAETTLHCTQAEDAPWSTQYRGKEGAEHEYGY